MATKIAILDVHRGDWTRQEQSEINRIRAFCREHPSFDIDSGQTDEDEPWCVVFDRECEEVVFHLARIESQYVIARPNQSGLQKTLTVKAAVDAVLDVLGCATHRTRHDYPDPPFSGPLVSPRA